jgi:hypothetical protein
MISPIVLVSCYFDVVDILNIFWIISVQFEFIREEQMDFQSLIFSDWQLTAIYKFQKWIIFEKIDAKWDLKIALMSNDTFVRKINYFEFQFWKGKQVFWIPCYHICGTGSAYDSSINMASLSLQMWMQKLMIANSENYIENRRGQFMLISSSFLKYIVDILHFLNKN